MPNIHSSLLFEEDDPFPLDAIPGMPYEMAVEVCRGNLVTPDIVGPATLGAISAAIGNGLRLATFSGYKARPNLGIIVSSDTGTGKNEGSEPLVLPLKEWETQKDEEFRMEVSPELRTKVAQIQQAKHEKKKEGDFNEMKELEKLLAATQEKLVRIPQYWVEDITKEEFGHVLSHQVGHACFSFDTEAQGTIGRIMGRYSGGQATDEGFFANRWSGAALKANRRSKQGDEVRNYIMVPDTCLSWLWLTQPVNFREWVQNPKLKDGGLLPRCLTVDVVTTPLPMPENHTGISFSTLEQYRTFYHRVLGAFRELDDTPVLMTSSSEASRLLWTYHEETRKLRSAGGQLEDLNDFVSRWSENAGRIALVLHVCKYGATAGKHEVSEGTAAAAVLLSRWFGRRIQDALSSQRYTQTNALEDRLLTLYKSKGWVDQTTRQLNRLYKITEKEIRALAKGSTKFQYYETGSPKQGGRPSKRLRLLDCE